MAKRDLEPGATGGFPEGKLDVSDEGELVMRIAVVEKLIRLEFGKPVAWFAIHPRQARELAKLLVKHADKLDKAKRSPL